MSDGCRPFPPRVVLVGAERPECADPGRAWPPTRAQLRAAPTESHRSTFQMGHEAHLRRPFTYGKRVRILGGLLLSGSRAGRHAGHEERMGNDQFRRLRRLEERLRARDPNSAEHPCVALARKWIIDHDVDPSYLDRWLQGEVMRVNLRTYCVLRDACFEAWDATGFHVPVDLELVWCERNHASPGRPTECDCEVHCGPVCKYTDWNEPPSERQIRYYRLLLSGYYQAFPPGSADPFANTVHRTRGRR